MKQHLLLVALISLVISGCSILGPQKQWAENNQFYSENNPSVHIKLDSEFTFIESTYKDGWTMDLYEGDSIISTSLKGFLFKDQQEVRQINLVVAEAKPTTVFDTHFYTPIFSRNLYPLNEGKSLLGTKTYQTAIVFRQKSTSGSVLNKIYGRLLQGGTYFYISYSEELLEQDTAISSQQIAEFSDRADSSIQVLIYDIPQQDSDAGYERFFQLYGKHRKEDKTLELYEYFGTGNYTPPDSH